MPLGQGRRVGRAGRVGTMLCACGLIVLCGCLPDQRAEVALYRSILDSGVNGPVQPLQGGEELTLLRALLLSNQENERLAIAGEDYVRGIMERQRAIANFLPTIGLEPTYTIVDNSDAATDVAGGAVGTSGGFKLVGRTQRRFEAPVVTRANLFRGFRDLATLRSSVRRIEERRQLLLDAQATLLLDVVRAYYQVLRLERSVQVLQKSLESQLERVREARARFEAGSGTPLDTAQSEAQAAATRVQLTQAQGDVRTARTLLAFLIGATAVDGPLRDDFEVPARAMNIDDLLEKALAARQDLAAAHAAVEAARYDVERAFAQYYPSVSLNLNAFLTREHFTTASKWNAILSLNLPLFTAGLIEADVREAWSLLRQRLLEESLLRRQVEQEVRFRYEDWLTSNAKLREIQAQIRATSEAYRQSRAGREAGTAITLDVLTAQDRLLQAQLQQATEEYNHKVVYLELFRTTGRLSIAAAQQAATRPSTTRPATTRPAAG